MNILITGGTGFIGRHLISDFLSRSPDIDFTVLTRKKAKQVSWLFPGIPPGKLQIINDTGELHDRHPDIMIHLAGAPVFSMLPFFENTAEHPLFSDCRIIVYLDIFCRTYTDFRPRRYISRSYRIYLCKRKTVSSIQQFLSILWEGQQNIPVAVY